MTIHSKSEGVLLLIMQVRTLMRRPANVFWDGGSDSNFVRDAFAKECGFKGTQVNLCVTTLGGVDKDFIEVTLYACFIIDVNGVLRFSTIQLGSSTGIKLLPAIMRILKLSCCMTMLTNMLNQNT